MHDARSSDDDMEVFKAASTRQVMKASLAGTH
jgi:hypothetical protein